MNPKLKEFLVRWINNTVAVLVAAHVIRGIHYDNITGLLVATLVLGILTAVLRPLVILLAFCTFGLLLFVVNGLLLYLVGNIVKGFHVDSFWPAFWGALVISFVSLVLNSLTGVGNSRISIRRGGPPPPHNPRDNDGGGPIIDV